MSEEDLRFFIDKFKKIGELTVVTKSDWNLEIGAISEISAASDDPPALLFEEIKDYPKGYRVLTNIFNSQKRTAIILGLQPDHTGTRLVKDLRKKMQNLTPIPPTVVKDGPITENIIQGDKIDILKFPVPLWHKFDGGRYIGTMDAVIMKDPETGWINIGTYRVQVQDKRTVSLYISPGKQGRIIREKYWSQGKNCPVVIVCGYDPTLFCISSVSIPWGVSEYDYAGGIRGKPYEVIKGKITGLPIPSKAEIVLEGECPPPEVESRPEGPFGEWTGYYASGSRNEPIVRVKTILHRNEPILNGYLHPRTYLMGYNASVIHAARIWDEIEMAGVPEVKGVWSLEAGHRYLIVISIRQLYSGHAKQAAFAALAGTSGAYHGRFVIIVDEDIDPSNLNDVLWALGTRSDPETSIDIVRGCWSTPLDPILAPEKRAVRNFSNSRAIIIACKPFHWIKDFPQTSEIDPEHKKQVYQKWKGVIWK
jgi:4-hydroxy-3-polyprenylbenzoate decarboxylase